MTDKLKLEVLFSAVDKVTRPLKAIRDASSQTSKLLKAAKDQLKELNAEQKRLDSFRSASRSLAIYRQDLAKAEERVKSIAQAMSQTTAPSSAMQKAFKTATDEARALKGQITQLQEKQSRLRSEMSASGIDTHKLAQYQRELTSRVNSATAALDQQTKQLEQVNDKMKKIHAARAQYDKTISKRDKIAGGAASTAALGASVGMPVLSAVKQYAVAEDAATQLKVALMGKGGKVLPEFEAINKLATELGNKLPGTTADYQNMMTMLIRQGMPAESILNGLGKATAYLGVQLKLPMDEAASFASKLQDATHTANSDMMGLMDVIQKTSNLGVEHGDMLQGFAKISPALSIIKREGLDAAKALAPLLVMTDQAGMAGEAAGNAYRKIFQMAMDTGKVAKGNSLLDGTGVKLDFTNGKGEFGGLDKMFAQLAQLKNVTTEKRLAALKKVFGDDAETLQALTVMIEKGQSGYNDVIKKMNDQASLQERVNVQLGTLKNLWDAASGTFTNAMVAWGESIAPEIKALTQWLGDLSEKVGAFAKEHPLLTSVMMKSAAVFAILLVSIGAIGIALATVMGPFAVFRYGWSMLVTLGPSVVSAVGSIGTAVAGFGMRVMVALGPLAALWASFEVGYAIGKKLNDILNKSVFGENQTLGTWLFDKFGGSKPTTPPPIPPKPKAVSASTPVVMKLAAAGAGVVIGGTAAAGGIPIDNRPPVSAKPAQITQHNTYGDVVVHAAPGMDEAALARAVRKEMDRRDADKAAAARSTLRDTH